MVWGRMFARSACPDHMDICWLHEDTALPSARPFTGAEGRRQTMRLSELTAKRDGMGSGAACRPEVHDQGLGGLRELFFARNWAAAWQTGSPAGLLQLRLKTIAGGTADGQGMRGVNPFWQWTKLWLWAPVGASVPGDSGWPCTPPSALTAAAQTHPGLDQKEAGRRSRARAEIVLSECLLATPLRGGSVQGPWAPFDTCKGTLELSAPAPSPSAL